MNETDSENSSLIEKAAFLIKEGQVVTALTGAGISAESGIPTFRGKDGLWQKFKPEELATPTAFSTNPKLVWEWYKYRIDLIKEAKPNPAHNALSELEKLHPDFLVMTQNVDNLHRRAGNKRIIEFHGNIFRARCTNCGRRYDVERFIDEELPRCPECGKLLRPDVVWFGESLDPQVIEESWERTCRTNVMIIVGTSLLVYPAAYLPILAKEHGAKIIEVNPEPTYISDEADVVLRKKAGEVLPKIVEKVREYFKKD